MSELQKSNGTQQNGAPSMSDIEKVLVSGDLSKLDTEQRLNYYNQLCQSLQLNPLTRPFEYITLSGKLTLYARKDATEQLRSIRNVSLEIKAREVIDGICVVTAGATLPNNRTDESTGAVPVEGLKGEAKANAMMKAETKAKRRVTLSICGLGMLDETEVDSIPGARIGEGIDIGNNPPNTAAAAAHVAQKKLEAGQSVEPPSAAKPWSNFKQFLEVMEFMRGVVGDVNYYRELGAMGYERANQIKKSDDAKAIYATLQEIQAIQQDTEEAVTA